MQVVHVDVWIERMSGPPFDVSEAHAVQWIKRGYAVTKAPDDGLEHPINVPCPVCPSLEPTDG